MSTPKTISFRIDSDKVEALDKIAANMRRDRSFLLNEAVDAYLQWNAGLEAAIREGLKAAKEGRWVGRDVGTREFAVPGSPFLVIYAIDEPNAMLRRGLGSRGGQSGSFLRMDSSTL